MSKPTAIDLFCGAGGLSLGLKQAGFDVRAAVEFDRLASKTYRRNLGDHLIEADIHSLDPARVLEYSGLNRGDCDLVAGGPPCQGFSIQRRGADQDARNDLVFQFLRFVDGIRPKFFLMENVSGLMSKRGKPFLDELIDRFTDLGYHTHLAKLEAAAYGTPQLRKRVILIGGLFEYGKIFKYPEEILGPDSYRTVRQAISDLPSPPLDGSPHPIVLNHAREARMSQINIERLKHIPPGGGRNDLPDHLQLPCHKNNPSHRHVEVYGRLAWDKPSGTITARFDSFTRGRYAHPVEHRSITLREGARLQTFPDDFSFDGNREEVARQIGNAVPPVLAKALGNSVIEALYSCKSNMAKGMSFNFGHESPQIQLNF
ncbi:DNA cytosine methyltransferase [Pseudomonas sp. SWRI100]|uniref:DNA cytosine methyltransferase n=1 Tax=Pseudomonas TaxID=286 RepID=UPI001644BBDD|nr:MULTISPECIES: DNA cytosine methyltransferase [Pseudomonas]MBC3494435.1 DNA cytosine methyltransferase [Pseudomonas sp. SWRI67]MBV4528817.1 DNA cytosine methyltransferase [Pseudomonas kermanshahensis]